jgi:hypothetical protein
MSFMQCRCFQAWRCEMRNVLSFGIAATLTVVTITALTGAAMRSQKGLEAATVGMDVFTLMTRSTDLQVQRYDAF